MNGIFLSKPQAWYIITRSVYIIKNGKAVFASHHGNAVYRTLRLDDIQFLSELMIYSPFGLMIYKAPP